MKKNYSKFILLLSVLVLMLSLFTANYASGQTLHDSEIVQTLDHVKKRITELPKPKDLDAFDDSTLSPCPDPEREPRFVYRENVVHEERQFRTEHPGCGGDILMRKWQVVGLQLGTCSTDLDTGEGCDPAWLEDKYVAYYDRYIPSPQGHVFEEVGSWQKAWPPTDLPEDGEPGEVGGTNPDDAWRTEKQLEKEYGEPVPFPTCQNDCLQAPPGIPEKLGEHNQEEPYYFNNPHLPESADDQDPKEFIKYLREEKNVLGGENSLDKVPLPTKIFWWNVPGWHEGWIEDGEKKECEGPDDIACVNSYLIRFDNINREDRPPELYRYQIVYKVKQELLDNGLVDGEVEAYKRAQKIFEDLERGFEEAYEEYRRHKDDTRSVDGLRRYDRDNILNCDTCGSEREIWLDTNVFNPLKYDPIMDYERSHRDWMLDYLLEDHNYQEVTEEEQNQFIDDLVKEKFNSYGRPAFFRSGTEHSYSLQAACSPHDYLEKSSEDEGEGEKSDKGEGRWGPKAVYSFLTHDGPELISPLDLNWVSPYEPKDYDPNHNEGRVRAGEDDKHYEDKRVEGYTYPPEENQKEEEKMEEGELSNLKDTTEFDDLDDLKKNLWNKDPGDLILQDQVPFKEEMEWAQIWYHQDPDRTHLHPAAPARAYKVSLGKSDRVTEEHDSDPVLEWCHPQLRKFYQERPICNFFHRRQHAAESINYPLPTQEDSEIEYFFLPDKEEGEEQVYSWSVAACRDQAEQHCTNYSQMWRFQVDENEENRIFAPRNVNPPNIKYEEVSEDDGTTGFPFSVKWDRHYGAETYVYRLRKAKEGEWSEGDALDAAVQRERAVRYNTDDLSVGGFGGILDLDTTYEWDVKGCWDEKTDHDKNTPEEILKWADENKSETCSDWRSEDFKDTAPFKFKTTGRPPEEKLYPKGDGVQAEYPINFQWGKTPGAKSYAILFCEGSTDGLDALCIPSSPPKGSMGIITNNLEYEYLSHLSLQTEHTWAILSCAEEIEEVETYHFIGDLFDNDSYEEDNTTDLSLSNTEQNNALGLSSDFSLTPDPKERWKKDLKSLHCNINGYNTSDFTPTLPPPDNLRPGKEQKSEPEIITLEESKQTISWDKIKGVEHYQIDIQPAGESGVAPTVYALEDYDFPDEKELIEDNSLTYDFGELEKGTYKIEVKGCLKSINNGEECANNMLAKEGAVKYIKVSDAEIDNEGLIRGVVPCGTERDIFPDNAELDSTESCRPIHLFVMFNLLIEEVLIKLIIPFSLLILVIYTAYLYYTAIGKPKTMQKVFTVWKAALRGYLLILLAWFIVGVLLAAVGYQTGVFGEWWKITF